MLIMIAVGIALCGGGLYGGYRAGRKIERIRSARTDGEQQEFDRLLEECRIGIGKLHTPGEKGEYLGRKMNFGGVLLTGAHDLSVGKMLVARLTIETCRRCTAPMYVGFEIAERAGEGSKKEKFVRQLCSVCLAAKCGLIERNASSTDSHIYSDLIEDAENMHDFLTRLLERRQERRFDALQATAPALLIGKTEG